MDRGDRVIGSEESDTAQPVLVVDDLRKEFVRIGGDTVMAIDGVSLDVRAGEFVVLLGPSGCGKTTLLRAIAGLERPDSGSISLHGRRVFSTQKGVNLGPDKRGLSMVFQSYALWPHMTVFKNVAYPLQCRRPRPSRSETRERVHEVLRLVGVPELSQQYAGQLSGGQQQRVALARALVGGADLILFDEPLSNVDAQVRETLRLELLEMQAQVGFSALFVTHDQQEAMFLADKVAVLQTGRIAQFGSPVEIYRHPNSRYVADFIGTTNSLSGTVNESLADGYVAVETGIGRVVGRAGAGPISVGTEVVAIWRPGDCAIGPSTDAPTNAWRGIVHQSRFLGLYREEVVDVLGCRMLVWDVDVVGGPAVGSSAWIAVSPDNVTVLPY